MWQFDTLSSYFTTVGGLFTSLADAIDVIPLLGGPMAFPFRVIGGTNNRVGDMFASISAAMDEIRTRLAEMLSWDQVYDHILGNWSWLTSPVEGLWTGILDRIQVRFPWLWDPYTYLWSPIRAAILGSWSWLNYIDDKIWNTVYLKLMSYWSWLNTIDDRIRNTVKAEWRWLDTIDDRIRDRAWSYFVDHFFPWLWDHVEGEFKWVAKAGYRILSTVWNMEWDDDNKEVKP